MAHDFPALTATNLYALKTELDHSGILFCYCGPISQELLESIGNSLRSQALLSQVEPNITKKLFSTFVEMMQNIVHYSLRQVGNPQFGSQANGVLPEGIVVIGQAADHYFVHSGNWISLEDGNRLQAKLLALQQMDKEQLKIFYKEQRRKSPEATSKGAGLGFIEMARQSTRMEFDIQPMNPTHAFFTLKVDF